jgi:hypothetical protein
MELVVRDEDHHEFPGRTDIRFDTWSSLGTGHVACDGKGQPLRIMNRGGSSFVIIDWAAQRVTVDWVNVPHVDVGARKKEEAAAKAAKLKAAAPAIATIEQKVSKALKEKKRVREEEQEKAAGVSDAATAPPKAKKPRKPLTPEQLEERRRKMALKKEAEALASPIVAAADNGDDT